MLAQGAEVPAYQDEPPVVGVGRRRIRRRRRPASQPGDRIVTVAGDEVDTWEDLFIAIGTRPDRDVALTLLRDGADASR